MVLAPDEVTMDCLKTSKDSVVGKNLPGSRYGPRQVEDDVQMLRFRPECGSKVEGSYAKKSRFERRRVLESDREMWHGQLSGRMCMESITVEMPCKPIAPSHVLTTDMRMGLWLPAPNTSKPKMPWK